MVVVLVDPAFDIDSFVANAGTPLFALYRHYLISEMGHQLRGKLIGKWVALSKDNWTDESETFQEIIEKEKIIESLLSRRMLPSHPIIILAMLQFLEASRNPHSHTGSYGELYQGLITDRLASVAKKPSDIGTWYTLLGRLAFFMFTAESNSVTLQRFRSIYNEYYAEFRIHFDVDTLLQGFIVAQILEKRDGNISFKYRDFYHFFAARYFSENANDPAAASSLRDRLQDMADHVCFEEYASILLFYLYLAKDLNVIQRLLCNARRIYAAIEPCNFDGHTQFLNRLYTEPPGVIQLPNGDTATNRDAYRAKMDDLEREAPDPWDGEKIAYSDELDDFVKITIALKSMYLLGQVLRAFPGAIKQDLKTQIARECYLLGLRVLTVAANSVEAHTDELRQYFATLIKEQRAVTKPWEIPASAEEVILNLMHAWAFGIIKKISESVGLAELEATYDEVLADSGELLSVQFVDLSIRLDHCYQFPEEQVRSLHSEVRKNRFSHSVFRDLVVHYFSLFRSTSAIRQKYGKLLGIEEASNVRAFDHLPKPTDN